MYSTSKRYFQASRLTYANGVVADEALPATDSNTAILRTYGLDAIAIVTARPDEVTLPGIGLLHQHEPDELLYFPVEKPYRGTTKDSISSASSSGYVLTEVWSLKMPLNIICQMFTSLGQSTHAAAPLVESM